MVLTQGENAIFENDNHSILTVAPVIPDTLVVVPHSVPEPASALMVLTLMTGSLVFSRRRGE
ncbi:MAG: PEP-CTERM sorting domain-containing protein [Proteobacteria bacterium]|nr:MAG: PEP-CTERM sorting domain-containing protein [Pseudomonadota bacterium]